MQRAETKIKHLAFIGGKRAAKSPKDAIDMSLTFILYTATDNAAEFSLDNDGVLDKFLEKKNKITNKQTATLITTQYFCV